MASARHDHSRRSRHPCSLPNPGRLSSGQRQPSHLSLAKRGRLVALVFHSSVYSAGELTCVFPAE